jgi:mono/diheme cytochrome c family protein
MKILGRLFVAGLVTFALMQLVRPGIPSKPATAEVQAPPEVKRILEKDCYSCHSDQRRLSWFDQIVPGYWLVRHDILTAREHLNFSTLGSKPAAAQKATLYEAVNMIQLGAMPLPAFVKLHPEAKVTPEDLATLKAYLSPWTPALTYSGSVPQSNDAKTSGVPAPVSLASVQQEFNGFPFDPDFENWKLISTTDRGDNNTFRFILGNDIAIKAAQSGNISPWPDGTRFAKIAWQQQLGPDGLVHPGKFVQVELMLKDAHRYKNTEGWGWGRWRGLDLKPYGEDARFVNECTGCHQPVRGNDYVYTLPITTATLNRDEVVNNSAAALPANLPYQPLTWNAITMYVDPKTHTMATLYGNPKAMEGVQMRGTSSLGWAEVSNGRGAGTRNMGAARRPALVRWTYPRPARIRGVRAGGGYGQTISYRRFAGKELVEEHPAASVAAQRTSFMLGLTPARLP